MLKKRVIDFEPSINRFYYLKDDSVFKLEVDTDSETDEVIDKADDDDEEEIRRKQAKVKQM